MPVVANLLTGFLGSGKTSLLRRLLRQPELQHTAVLINEFGEVGLDHLLVEPVAGDLVVLKNGCVCCSIRGDVKEALLRLAARSAAGEVPNFTRVVIETTGLAEPAPILATLSADPMLRHQYRIGSTVTVIDAVGGAANLDRFREAALQVAAADRLVISKADLASKVGVQRLVQRLSAVNPTAPITPMSESDAAPARLLLEEAPPAACLTLAGDSARVHADVGTFTITADEPLDWGLFGLWLSMLLHRHGASILRLKGLVWLQGVNEPLVIQGVQHLIHRPEHLDCWPAGRPRTELVVIARGLDAARVRRSFQAFMGLTAQPADSRPVDASASSQAPTSSARASSCQDVTT